MRRIEVARLIMVSTMVSALGACALFVGEPRGASPLSAAPVTEQTLAEARSLFEMNNPGLALLRVEAYLAVDPNSAGAHNLAGAIYDRIGRYDIAQSHYEAALVLDENYLPAVNNFGLSKLQRAQATARLDLAQPHRRVHRRVAQQAVTIRVGKSVERFGRVAVLFEVFRNQEPFELSVLIGAWCLVGVWAHEVTSAPAYARTRPHANAAGIPDGATGYSPGW